MITIALTPDEAAQLRSAIDYLVDKGPYKKVDPWFRVLANVLEQLPPTPKPPLA